jgi:hypothetical protein
MMQSCASGAKLRGGGPILNRGSKAMSNIGLPPPRLVICGLISTGEQTAEPQSCVPCLIVFPSDPAGSGAAGVSARQAGGGRGWVVSAPI